MGLSTKRTSGLKRRQSRKTYSAARIRAGTRRSDGSDNAKFLPSLKDEDEYELVHVGPALGVFCGPYGGAGKGWSRPRELKPGDRHQNRGDSDLRLVGRSLHE